MTSARKPGERAGLTVGDVRTEALAMLDEAGAAGLTMRGLADRLGVRANTLYSYTENKVALIDDVLDDVLAEVAPPASGDDPATALFSIMRSTYDVLISHRQLVPLYVQQQGARGENAVRLGHEMEEILAARGIAGALAEEARHVLIVFTIGAAAYSTGAPLSPDASSDDRESRAFNNGLEWLIRGIFRES